MSNILGSVIRAKNWLKLKTNTTYQGGSDENVTIPSTFVVLIYMVVHRAVQRHKTYFKLFGYKATLNRLVFLDLEKNMLFYTDKQVYS